MNPFRFLLLSLVLHVAAASLNFPAPGPKTANDPNGRVFSCVNWRNVIKATECEVVTLPAEFCAVCGKVGVIQDDGKYADCTRASWTLENDNGECISKFAEYSALNSCDPERAAAVDMYLNPGSAEEKENARQKLDFLVYALCENICDCVPQRSSNPNFKDFDVTRGSCQGHAQDALCRSYPNVKLIQGESDLASDVSSLEPVCLMMRDWFANLTQPALSIFTGADVAPEVEVFLTRMLLASQILEDNILWEECLYLEGKSVVRVEPALETVYPDINCRPLATSGCPNPLTEVVMKRTDIFGTCSEHCISHRMVKFYKDVLGFACGVYCD